MSYKNPFVVVFCLIVLALFVIGMWLMLTRNNETAIGNSASIILYCFSGVPITIIVGIVLVLFAGIFYILSNILVAYNRNITQSQVEMAEALNQRNNNNGRIIINTGDTKQLSNNNNQEKPNFNGNKGLYEVPRLNLNDYND